ncbi:hypothetical protein SAMN00790413_04042 [Deinococcus hopiensis KR-140]|uniref:Uncharacterized protein n=1 Tax=Deinococcus hopiensis KR-140 TaxID=695939 RepID=A0A1W1UNW9_9DEIO|nr:hypothetical protein SAMN00790413_04042 [Deinococcus hopiensis KR-140]
MEFRPGWCGDRRVRDAHGPRMEAALLSRPGPGGNETLKKPWRRPIRIRVNPR